MKKLTILDLVAQVIYEYTYDDLFAYFDEDELEVIEQELEKRLKHFKDE